MSKILYFASGGLSVLALAFFLIGCAGYADNETTIQNVAWIKFEQDGDAIWFALHKAYVDVGSFYTGALSYDSSSCIDEFCHRCDRDGKATFSLVLIAAVFAVITAVISSSLVASSTFQMRTTNIITSLISFGASLVGVGLFMRDCYKKVENSSDGGHFTWGSGAILSLIGMVIMFTVMVLQWIVLALNIRGEDVNVPLASDQA